MTSQNRSNLKGSFETGDIPQGSDFANLIDSFVSLTDSTAQAMASDLQVPVLISTSQIRTVSAASVLGAIHTGGGPNYTGFNYTVSLLIDGSGGNPAIVLRDTNAANPFIIGNTTEGFVIATGPALGDTSTQPRKYVRIIKNKGVHLGGDTGDFGPSLMIEASAGGVAVGLSAASAVTANVGMDFNTQGTGPYSFSVGGTQVIAASASGVNIAQNIVYDAELTAAVAATGSATVPTSGAAGFIVMQVCGQSVGLPYFKMS